MCEHDGRIHRASDHCFELREGCEGFGGGVATPVAVSLAWTWVASHRRRWGEAEQEDDR
jgi:hypothetical protein